MAADAKIEKVEELITYSNRLGNFLESMSKNMNAFDCVMMQKLESLRKMKIEMEEIEKKAIAECRDCERELAYCPSVDAESKRHLMSKLKEAEHKMALAQRTSNEVSTRYNVARGAIQCMLDNTKNIQNHIQSDITKGRDLLQKAAVHLDEYKKSKS